jgi:starch phosphorylase
MKAALNGALNCSILDGWWDEMYEPDTGWAIQSAEWQDDLDERNRLEANSMMTILERQVVPLFYERDADGLPVQWVQKVKRMLAKLGPKVEASRMLEEYVVNHYEPAAARSGDLAADHYQRAKAFVRWKRIVFRAWPSVAVMATGYEELPGADESTFRVSAQVALGDLEPNDVEVQLIYGKVQPDDELHDTQIVAMTKDGDAHVPGWHRYVSDLSFDSSGNFGFTVRVVPSHPDLLTPAFLARVAWAPAPAGPPGSG